MGPTARIVSFSSERLPNSQAFRNTLLLCDARSRASLPFREVGGEDTPMLGIRSSPSGRYLLVLLRGAPSEIWAVSFYACKQTTFESHQNLRAALPLGLYLSDRSK